MTPLMATCLFYTLLVAAVLCADGQFGTADAPRVGYALGFALLALGAWVLTRGRASTLEKGVVTKRGSGSRLARLALAGTVGAALFALFLGPLPWVAEKISRPQGEGKPVPGDQTPRLPEPGTQPGKATEPDKKETAKEPPPADEGTAAASAPEPAPELPPVTTEEQRPWWLIAGVTLLVLLLLSALTYFWRKSRNRAAGASAPGVADPLADQPEYFRAFVALCTRWGRPCLHGDTFRDLLKKLAGASLPTVPFEPAARYHYATRYAGAERDEKREAGFVEEVRRAGAAGKGE